MFKKITIIAAALLLVISLVACNPTPNHKPKATESETTKIETTVNETTVDETEASTESVIDFEGFPTAEEMEKWCKEHYGEAKFVNLVSLSEYDPDAEKYDDKVSYNENKDSENTESSLSNEVSDTQSFYNAYVHKQYKMKDIANDFEYIVYVYHDYAKSEYVIEEQRTTFIQQYSKNFFNKEEVIINSLKEKYGTDFEASMNQECFSAINGKDEKALKAAGEELCGLIAEYDQRRYLTNGEIMLIALYKGDEMIGYYDRQRKYNAN